MAARLLPQELLRVSVRGRCKLPGEEVCPTGDFWVLSQQRAALTLSHAAPHTEFHIVIKRISTALENHRTVTTDSHGLALRGAADKELLGINIPAVRLGDPFPAVSEGFPGGDLLGDTADDAGVP